MFATRVRNPKAKLMKDVQGFTKDPKARAEHLFRLSQQEGYVFIQAAVLGLMGQARDDRDIQAFKYAAMLAQPEWTFYSTDKPDTLAVGVEEEGEFMPIGRYTAGDTETGAVALSPYDADIVVLDPVKDPRDKFVSSRIKQKVYRKGRKYFVVECAKDKADLEYFYAADRIHATRRPGYLWRYEAFVFTAGPFKTSAEAHENRIQILGDDQ